MSNSIKQVVVTVVACAITWLVSWILGTTRRSVLRANKGIKFRASHPLSHLLVNNGRVELGTRAAGYFKLLTMPVDSLTEIYAAWVVKGDT